MADGWLYTFEDVDVPNKLLTVIGTRTQGVDVRVYRLPNISVDQHDKPLVEIRDAIAAKMRQMYLDEVAGETKLSDMLDGWAAALATATNALEVG